MIDIEILALNCLIFSDSERQITELEAKTKNQSKQIGQEFKSINERGS